MEQPIFFIIGAQRCGTTFLYNQLEAHPEISMSTPVKPEPKYFLNDQEVNKGKQFYLEKYFGNLTQEKVIGEKSTSYIEYPESGRKILNYFPNAKFIVVLRNPMDRAISNYKFSRENGIETRKLKEVFIDRIAIPELAQKNLSVSPFDYLERGNYLQYLDKYEKVIGKGRLKIVFFEKLTSDIKYLQKIYSELGVSGSYCPPNFRKKANATEQSTSIGELEEVRECLRKHFEPINSRLAESYNLELEIWK
ncbi:MAG: sulfotransferase [Flavobacteriales bacterium]|nr:sulfotransferase [Flavobacteriales bacterium]